LAELVNRSTYEATIARVLAEFLSARRRELSALVIAGTEIPPSFWSAFQAELNNLLQPYMSALHLQSSLEHFTSAISTLPVQAEVTVGAGAGISTAGAEARLHSEAIQWGTNRALDISGRMTGNIQAEIESKVADYRTIRAVGEPVPQAKIRDDLLDSLGPSRAADVTTTEITHAAASGGEAGMRTAGNEFPEAGGPDEFDLWINNPHLSKSGPCPICEPLHKTPRKVWAEQFPDGPPAHWNCVCEIDYANGPGPGKLRGAEVLPSGEKVVDLFRRAQDITGPLL